MKNKKEIYMLVLNSVLIALGVVLSSFLQIPIYSDIRIDLSYVVIIVMCLMYNPIQAGLSAMCIAMLESSLFTQYGFSISWATANFVVGFGISLAFMLTKTMRKNWLKHVINVGTIVVSVAIGMLFVKTIIECNLYNIPFEVKIVKNSVAFGIDTAACLLGYLAILPRLLKMKLNGLEANNEVEEVN